MSQTAKTVRYAIKRASGAAPLPRKTWGVLPQIKALGFRHVHAITYWSRDLAYLGGNRFQFTTRNPLDRP